MTNHHPLSGPSTRSAVEVAYELVRHRFQDLDEFLDLVGWTRADLDAWLQDPEAATFEEVATFFLTALDIPRGGHSGPLLPALSGGSEVGSDRAKKSEIVRESRTPSATPPSLSGGAEASRDYPVDSVAESGQEAGAADGGGTEDAGHVFLGFLRWVERAMVQAETVTWDAVIDSYRQSERYRNLHEPPKT